MHSRLVSYLLDNRDHIIENWLTDAEISPPFGSKGTEEGVVPYAFFASAFDSALKRIEQGPNAMNNPEALHINQFLGITCDCRERCFGGRVCMELHEAGLEAFMSVFDADWDAEHEFSQLDRECSKDLINHALSGFFGQEIETCHHKTFRSDCPFVAHN
jgi:hypothetical protein